MEQSYGERPRGGRRLHLARSAGAEDVGLGQQALRQAAAAEGARSGADRAVAGLVRGKPTGAADHRPAPQVVLAVATRAVGHLLRTERTQETVGMQP